MEGYIQNLFHPIAEINLKYYKYIFHRYLKKNEKFLYLKKIETQRLISTT